MQLQLEDGHHDLASATTSGRKINIIWHKLETIVILLIRGEILAHKQHFRIIHCPIGPLVASAVAQGYAKSRDGTPTPYRGYYYHILTHQGKYGPGGTKNYIVNGKMTEGFAFVAYPAEYRSSGVMSFMVNEDGVVYQKDLGKKTEVLAKGMKEYNPDSSWQKTEEQEETAAEQKTK
jgi:hypothetical protein